MKIYVIRHGETDTNKQEMLQGQCDDPINENGVLLAEITGRAMRGIRFDGCISSPLQRATKTAEIVLRESGNGDVPIETDDRLMEIEFGEWEHKHLKPEYGEVDPELLEIFYHDTLRFPGAAGGESIDDVCRRTQAALKELIARDDGRTWLVSMHGCSLRAMLNFLYDDPSDFWHGHVPYNCSVTIIEAEGGKACIIQDDIVYYDRSLIVDRYAAGAPEKAEDKDSASMIK